MGSESAVTLISGLVLVGKPGSPTVVDHSRFVVAFQLVSRVADHLIHPRGELVGA